MKIKVGQKVEFNFAGAVLQGTVERIAEGKYWVYDHKYKYPVRLDKIIKVIK